MRKILIPTKPWMIISGLIVLTILLELIFRPHHPAFVWQKIPGFYGILGLLGGFFLMKLAKLLGKYILHRNETYYDRHL